MSVVRKRNGREALAKRAVLGIATLLESSEAARFLELELPEKIWLMTCCSLSEVKVRKRLLALRALWSTNCLKSNEPELVALLVELLTVVLAVPSVASVEPPAGEAVVPLTISSKQGFLEVVSIAQTAPVKEGVA